MLTLHSRTNCPCFIKGPAVEQRREDQLQQCDLRIYNLPSFWKGTVLAGESNTPTLEDSRKLKTLFSECSKTQKEFSSLGFCVENIIEARNYISPNSSNARYF